MLSWSCRTFSTSAYLNNTALSLMSLCADLCSLNWSLWGQWTVLLQWLKWKWHRSCSRHFRSDLNYKLQEGIQWHRGVKPTHTQKSSLVSHCTHTHVMSGRLKGGAYISILQRVNLGPADTNPSVTESHQQPETPPSWWKLFQQCGWHTHTHTLSGGHLKAEHRQVTVFSFPPALNCRPWCEVHHNTASHFLLSQHSTLVSFPKRNLRVVRRNIST